MRINIAVPEEYVSAPVLNAGLEATTRLNEAMIRGGELELFDPRRPQARWKPEPPGQGEHFDHGRLVIGRGWGDCDDLAPWRAASLRVTGEDPDATAIVRRSGPGRWHAIVRRDDGRIDDPSLAAGMPGKRTAGIYGAVQAPMCGGTVVGGAYVVQPQLAMRPVTRGEEIEAWEARTDLPWHGSPGLSPTDVAMVSLHSSPVSSQALVGALEGAILLGETSDAADEEHLDRLRCLSDMVQGAEWEDCADVYGEDCADYAGEVVGAFFRKLRRKLKRGIKKGFGGLMKAAPFAAQFVPGIGPVARMALKQAAPALQRMVSKDRHVRPSQRRIRAPGKSSRFPVYRCYPESM